MFEMNRNAHFWLITAANLVAGTYTAKADVTTAMEANEIPGVTAFGYDHENDVQRRGKGQFGKNKPVGITDEYNGIKGNFDVEGFEGEQIANAILNGKLVSEMVNTRYNRLREFYAICNTRDDSGAPMNAHFLDSCKLDGVPKNVSGEAKRFSFQGIQGTDFPGKQIRFHVVDGNAVPVTAIPLPTDETALAWQDENDNDRYALLVLRYDGANKTTKRLLVAEAAAAGYFTEVAGALTLAAGDGLAATDKLLVAYVTA